MVLSRGLATLKLLKTASNFSNGVLSQSVRHSHGTWVYRTINTPPRKNIIMAEAVGGVVWWWILWHLFTEPGHIVGEFPYPDPEKWTDEELGIPPDDAE